MPLSGIDASATRSNLRKTAKLSGSFTKGMVPVSCCILVARISNVSACILRPKGEIPGSTATHGWPAGSMLWLCFQPAEMDSRLSQICLSRCRQPGCCGDRGRDPDPLGVAVALDGATLDAYTAHDDGAHVTLTYIHGH